MTTQQLKASGVSDVSLQVIDHFGADAPAVLNDYACKVEDALVNTNQQLGKSVNLLKELNTEHKAYTKILTDPNVLADYTTKFFGPNGPFPVQQAAPTAQSRPASPQEQQAAQQQAMRAQAAAAVAGNAPQRPAGQTTAAPAPQRPQMPVPPQPQAKGNPTEFWNNFGSAADRDPQNAWKYLSAAQQNPEIFRQKLLVME